MSLPRFSINQSLFVNLVSAIIIIIGLLVVFGINKEIFPNVSFDTVSITTAYPGATPLDIEKLITVPIEKELKEVDYYLELSKSDQPVYHNLALIGPRSVGKTSLLNMIEHISKKKDMLAVKVSLNEEISCIEGFSIHFVRA